MFKLPEAAHGLHFLQVPVEGQSAQTEAVAAVANGLKPLHLFNNGGHRYRWRYSGWWEFCILLARLITQSLFVWPKIKNKNKTFYQTVSVTIQYDIDHEFFNTTVVQYGLNLRLKGRVKAMSESTGDRFWQLSSSTHKVWKLAVHSFSNVPVSCFL